MKKMKVSKKRLEEALAYRASVNSVELEDLDLSEFFIEDENLEQAIDKFGFTGLNNTDFIFSDYPARYNVARISNLPT